MTLLIFPELLKFFSKFDVRMNYHQSCVFLQDLSNSFHCWFNLSISSFRGVSTILDGVSRCHSRILKTKEEFSSKSYLFSQRFVILACCHPLIIVFDCENSFHLSGAIQDSFQFDSPKTIISGLLILSFQISFSKSYRCIIQVFSNQFVISSFSYI